MIRRHARVAELRRCAFGSPGAMLVEPSSGSLMPAPTAPPALQWDLPELCAHALRDLKLRCNSNVVPLGAVTHGVCRHRAILFKYLCDNLVPVLPCSLVGASPHLSLTRVYTLSSSPPAAHACRPPLAGAWLPRRRAACVERGVLRQQQRAVVRGGLLRRRGVTPRRGVRAAAPLRAAAEAAAPTAAARTPRRRR